MAIVNLTKTGKNNQKRGFSVAVVTVEAPKITLDTLVLLNVPKNSIMKKAYLITENACDAGTTVNIGYTGGTGVELFSAKDLTATPDHVFDFPIADALSGAGKQIVATPNKASVTGKFTFVLEYIELDLTKGAYTN